MNYTLQQLKYLVAVAEHKSVTAAARANFVSQPGISTAIQNLEKVFDICLFERPVPRTIALTVQGKAFAAEVKEVLARANHLQHIAKEIKQASRPTLSIGCTPITGSFYLPHILERFRPCTPRSSSQWLFEKKMR